MSNVFVTTRLQGQGQTAVPVHLNGTVSDPPPGLEKLENGDLLQGTVVGHDKKGRLLVRTNLGVLHISTQQSLPEGTEVTLQIRHAGARLHVLILLARNTVGQGTTPHDTTAPQSTGHRPPAGDSILLGQRVNAAVIAASSTPIPGLEITVPPGTVLQGRVISVGLPPSSGAASPEPSAATSAPDKGTVPEGRNARLPTGGDSASLQQSAKATEYKVTTRATSEAMTPEMLSRVTTAAANSLAGAIRSAGTTQMLLSAHAGMSLSSGNAPPGVSPSISSPGTHNEQFESPQARASGEPFSMKITGQVVGATGDGQPVLRTALGLITLAVQTAIPIRSSVAIELSLNGLKPTTQSPGMGGPSPSSLPTAPEISGAEPMMTFGNLQVPVPEAGPRLAPGILLLLAALKGGRLSQWLSGAEVRQIRTSGAVTGDSSAAEAVGMARHIETSSGDWRLYLIPMLHENLRENLRLYVRTRDESPGRVGSRGDRKTRRFIVEADLSHLGSVQLDGFVTPKRFDLIFRSEKALSVTLRQGIKNIYDSTLRSEDWRGQLSFAAFAQGALGGTDTDPFNIGSFTV